MKNLNQNIALQISLLLLGAFLYWYNPELYGDLFRLMLIPLGIYWLLLRDISHVKAFIIVCVIILGIAFSIKLAFSFAQAHFSDSHALETLFEIARRPINGEYNGFPSGHTCAAFLAAALSWRYIGARLGFVVFILAGMVGLSRVMSLWHTPLQVCVGAFLGFVGGWFVISILQSLYTKRLKQV